MKIAVFSAKKYDREFLSAANGSLHKLRFFEPPLNEETVGLATGFEAVCVFVNDHVDAAVIAKLRSSGVRLIALRCAGYNNVDLSAATKNGVTVVRVPAYSPYAVAEHTIALMLALNRKLHRAYNRVREGNFALDGLIGFDMHDKTVGVIGTGQIGTVVARILLGFGCPTLAFDPFPNATCGSLGVRYVELNELLAQSDVISLHCPLTPENKHIINDAAIGRMKKGVMLVNTSRAALIEKGALVSALKNRRPGMAAVDVYEVEPVLDIRHPLFAMDNVVCTPHIGYVTRDEYEIQFADVFDQIVAYAAGRPINVVNPQVLDLLKGRGTS